MRKRIPSRFVPQNWFLGLAISSCVLIGTYCFYPPSPKRTVIVPSTAGSPSAGQTQVIPSLPVTQRFLDGWVVLWLIGKVFFLRLLGFRTTQILIPLVVLLSMMF